MRSEIDKFFTNGEFKRRLEQLYFENITKNDKIGAQLNKDKLQKAFPIFEQLKGLITRTGSDF